MKTKRKICVVTGSRAEYGLLAGLIKLIASDAALELQLVVTGMHLSAEFGLTYQEIEQDGFPITRKIEILLSSDSTIGVSKSVGLGIMSFSEALQQLNPDIVVLLGDRSEIFAFATAALFSKIPVAHIHGGELSEGAVDDALRHSITKMAHLHFAASDTYCHRIIQLGEQPTRVFNVGAMGVECIKQLKLLSREELQNSLQIKFNKKNLLITFHPETLEENGGINGFENLLLALASLKETNLFFTKANSDASGRRINSMIDEFVVKNSAHAWSFVSLGQLRYLSLMQYMDGVVGNSSSGIIEAPTMKIGTINMGERQGGRDRAISVIDCSLEKEEIEHALRVLYSKDFQHKLLHVVSPFGEGGAAQKILAVLKTVSLETLVKKKFYNMKEAEVYAEV